MLYKKFTHIPTVLGCGGWLLVQSTVAWLWVEMYAGKALNKQTDEMNSEVQLDIIKNCNPPFPFHPLVLEIQRIQKSN